MNIREIAKKAKCSPATVSRVLSGRKGDISISEKTWNKIMDICREHDYHPSIHAARLFSKKSKMIGFLYGGQGADVYNENRSLSLFYCTKALAEANYRLLPIVDNAEFYNNEDFINIFKRGEIDGLIVWGPTEKDYPFLKRLLDMEYPFVCLTNKISDCPSVYSDQRAMVECLTLRCIERGAKKIVGIMPQDGYCYEERYRGFQAAIRRHDVKAVELRELDTSSHISLQDTCETAFKEKPDAIICANDESAVYLEMCLVSKGVRIPNDIMITGGDNLRLSQYCPIPLTTFDPMPEQCAQESVKIMIEHLEKKTSLHSHEVQSQLVWRDSLPE